MKKVLVIFGYGPGISNGVAEKFGKEGFSVALVSRSRERLDAGVGALRAQGIEAAAFVADAGDPASVRTAIAEVRAQLGPITVIEWTAYTASAGDVLTASAEDLRSIFEVPIVGLTTAVQAALPDLQKGPNGAVLVTNGGFGLFDPAVDQLGVDYSAMGLSIANSAKRKLVGLLALKLKPLGVYVGEIVVVATVKGTVFDSGHGTLDAADVGNEFWRLYTARAEHSVMFG